MEDFLEATFYGNTVLEWATALAIVVGALVVGKAVYWVFQNVARRLTAKTQTKLDDIILDMIEEPIVVIVTVLGFWAAVNTLTLSDRVTEFFGNAMQAAITLSVAWLLARLIDSLIQEYLVPLAEKSETDLDDQLLPIARKGAKLAIWALGIIIALNNAGQDVGALLAGLGVGGLALAIAAQDTVANIFGSATIFADRPFAIKDRIRIKGYDGVVREIGLRSTRLETRDGPIVTIPNSVFTGSPVENVSAGPLGRRVKLELGLVYDTTAAQMRRAMDILHEISAGNDGVGDNVNISFSAYGDSAMVIRYAYFVNPGASFRGVQSEVNMAILEQYGAEGLDFAYPTQTIYTIGGGGDA
ncbi:MAG: mechanosensitive ion channel family protein [Acidobacteriota bacterium]